jgi:SAM-dependent methyltransferase
MRNKDLWKETLVIYKNGKFSVNESFVGYNSILVCSQVLPVYEELIRENARGVLLDLGCGTVPYYNLYNGQVENIICIDWGESFHQCIHLDHIVNLNNEIPLENELIDTVILTDVLEHIWNPEKLMIEVSRIMKLGGKLILGVPFFYCLHEEPHDFFRFTKHKLIDFCEKNHLKVICFYEIGGPISVICDIIGKNIPSPFFSKYFQKLALLFLATKLGRKLDERNKSRFPRSYCLVAEKI